MSSDKIPVFGANPLEIHTRAGTIVLNGDTTSAKKDTFLADLMDLCRRAVQRNPELADEFDQLVGATGPEESDEELQGLPPKSYEVDVSAYYCFHGTVTVVARSQSEAESLGRDSIGDVSMSMGERVEGSEYAEAREPTDDPMGDWHGRNE